MAGNFREWVATEDISTTRFTLRRGMTVPEKYGRPQIIPMLRATLKEKYGHEVLTLKSEFLKQGNTTVGSEVEQLKIELRETQTANAELATKNAALKSELRKLQKRE